MSRTESPTEERANHITHLIGMALSAVGLVFLSVLAFRNGSLLAFACYSIFGISLLMLYTASTLYHSAKTEKNRHRLKIFDHAAIYVLIAGSYTPFMALNLRGTWGWGILGTVWSLALVGIIFKLGFVHRFKILSTLIYLAMGWIVIIAFKPLAAALPSASLHWLIAGGLAYSFGVIFYLWDGLRFNHAVWHLFVLGGSVCHFQAVVLAAP